MDIRPILSTLRRHKTAAALIVLEVALTCAIVSNALFLITERLQRMEVPTGLAESELVTLRLGTIARVDNADVLTRQDMATLRALPGVRGATALNQLPFGRSASNSALRLDPDQTDATLVVSTYFAGDDALATLGLRLVEGRDFLPDERTTVTAVRGGEGAPPRAVMLDRATAERLYPGRSAIGQDVYVFGNAPLRIVGIVERLLVPHFGGPEGDWVLITPAQPTYREGSYVLRVDPSRRQDVLTEAVAALEALDARRVVTDQGLFSDRRLAHFEQDRWMTWLLAATCLALPVVTAFGIVGLASFWVQQRTRMIGVRRALGASRRQVLGYFQTENFLLTGMGIALGRAGAYASNHVLMTEYEMQRLPWVYLPVGAATLWLLGQVAVLGPARRAAALPPVVVMRGA